MSLILKKPQLAKAMSQLGAAAGLRPVEFSTSASVQRWHKDVSNRRQIFRYGYHDKTKWSGALPRISEDDQRWDSRKPYTPANPWAQKRALFGQNDYIDILGEDPDAFRPSDVNYEQPEWLREMNVYMTPYQRLLMKKKLLEDTSYKEAHPKTMEQMEGVINRQHLKMKKEWDQYRFTNYQGIQTGDANLKGANFRTRRPF